MERTISGQAPDGTELVFRAPTREEVADRTNGLGAKPDTVIERELCFKTVQKPDLEAFKGIAKRWPGIPRAAYESLLEEVGYSTEFKEDGEHRVAKLSDGTVVKIRAPSDAAWNAFRDDKTTLRAQRLDDLAIAMLVEPAGDAAGALLNRYPALVLPISDEAVEMVGANIKFTAKKG